jgi:hypothetical protein
MRIIRSPSLSGTSVLWALILLAFWLSFVAVPVGWRGAVWMVCLGALFYAIIGTMDTVIERILQYQRRVADVEAHTAEVRKLEIIASMTAEQIQFILANSLVFSVLVGSDETLYTLRWMGEEIPFTFIEDFMESGDGNFLYPVGRYSDGTNERRWAQALTNLVVSKGWAEEARGRYPARWVNYDEACRRFGVGEG